MASPGFLSVGKIMNFSDFLNSFSVFFEIEIEKIKI